MGPYLPRCYGVCVVSRTAFLITSLVHDSGKKPKLTKAERYAVLQVIRV
jgi:hypothetical protein